MKKLVLLIALVFGSINLNAATLWGQENANTSYCSLFASWVHPTFPQGNTCFDIRGIESSITGWEDTYGTQTNTSSNHEGSSLWIVVDVFGVPADEPTVMYKYQTLNVQGYTQLINYNSSPAIINGKRYYFKYTGDVGSGDIIVKHYSNYVDQLHVK